MSLGKKVWQGIYNWMGIESTQETLMNLGAWKIKQRKEVRYFIQPGVYLMVTNWWSISNLYLGFDFYVEEGSNLYVFSYWWSSLLGCYMRNI